MGFLIFNNLSKLTLHIPRAVGSCLTMHKHFSLGLDQISYVIIKKLPDSALDTVLSVCNAIWKSRRLPVIWNDSTIFPIMKSNTDKIYLSSYRTIALTSSLCKILERRMIVKRLSKIS